MPTQRRPLGEISRNISKRKELSLYIRAQIISASKCSVNPTQISKQLSILRSIVQSTLDRDELRNNYTSLPWSSRPRLSSKQDERLLLYVVHQFPKYTYK
jgi:hypothetical protein